jgi:hypothetical protein
MNPELPIRITLVHRARGVAFHVQRGKADLVPPTSVTEDAVSFDLTVQVRERRPGQPPDFGGPFVQGPRDGRFVYVNSGTRAGQAESAWSRRAKVPLSEITWQLVDQALAKGLVLEARITGTGRDGGPPAATVPLLPPGWSAKARTTEGPG